MEHLKRLLEKGENPLSRLRRDLPQGGENTVTLSLIQDFKGNPGQIIIHRKKQNEEGL